MPEYSKLDTDFCDEVNMEESVYMTTEALVDVNALIAQLSKVAYIYGTVSSQLLNVNNKLREIRSKKDLRDAVLRDELSHSSERLSVAVVDAKICVDRKYQEMLAQERLLVNQQEEFELMLATVDRKANSLSKIVKVVTSPVYTKEGR